MLKTFTLILLLILIPYFGDIAGNLSIGKDNDICKANIKLGLQHEGSTLFTVAGLGVNDTIFLTGSLPVSLKHRQIGFTGTGVSAFIYKAPTYTGGTSVAYQNPNSINPVTGLSQIIVGSTVSDDGVLRFEIFFKSLSLAVYISHLSSS
jgi:hypothetical protein